MNEEETKIAKEFINKCLVIKIKKCLIEIMQLEN
jgi:hypothetical protein